MGRLKALLAVAACVAFFGAVHAQQRGTTVTAPGALTAQDYAEIYQLYAHYPFAFDGGLDNGMGWAGLFVSDGAHISGGGAAPGAGAGEYVQGTMALAAFASGRLAYARGGNLANATFVNLRPEGTKTPLRVGHWITNVMLDPTPEGVNSKAYLIRVNRGADGEFAITQGGIYFDTLVKTPDGWRFRLKHFIGASSPANPVPATVPDSFKVKPESLTSSR